MVQKVDTLSEINLKEVLGRVVKKYGLTLPKRVVMADYDEEVGSLFIKFKHKDVVEGEPTDDGLVILHYGRGGDLVTVEITDVTEL